MVVLTEVEPVAQLSTAELLSELEVLRKRTAELEGGESDEEPTVEEAEEERLLW